MDTSRQAIVAAPGYGSSDQTIKRATRLACEWMRMKAKPWRIKDLASDLEVHWRTVYFDIVDLQLEPLEPGFVLTMVGCGRWEVRDIRQQA